jgi:hypothetical protein
MLKINMAIPKLKKKLKDLLYHVTLTHTIPMKILDAYMQTTNDLSPVQTNYLKEKESMNAWMVDSKRLSEFHQHLEACLEFLEWHSEPTISLSYDDYRNLMTLPYFIFSAKDLEKLIEAHGEPWIWRLHAMRAEEIKNKKMRNEGYREAEKSEN